MDVRTLRFLSDISGIALVVRVAMKMLAPCTA